VRQRNHIAKIKTASDGLMHIIDDILDFSKIEAGKLQIENVPFELEEVFERLSSLMALRAESQGIELTYNVASGTPAVLVGDALRLGQILINLLSNAMKFSSGGNVVVEVHSIPLHDSLAELHFSVSDEGIGISDEQISQMFQPFIQADLSTTRRFGGTGLGLAISRHLVNLLGGRIWVESTVGVGSTFHFTAQFACSPDRRSQGVAQLSAQLATHSNQVILVIDDNPLARKLLAHLVSQLGLNAIALQSGQEAIDLLESADAPQVLACLVDWFMPEPNGIETITKIRAIYANRGSPCPPVILVTAHSQDNALRRVLHHTDGLLAKPVTARNFYEEMARCLGVSNALRARTGYRKVDDLQWSRFYALDVLLVEDMDINREVLSELLSGVGLQVRLATNGAEALAQVAQKIPDVILMDCHMPVMDGYTATRQLRANPVHSDISIIALTASAMADDRRQCLDAGMNAYVTKPVHLQDLYEQIVRCLPNASTVATPSNAPDQGDFSHVNAEVPKFRGIDSALGLAQVGGRIPLYLQVLKKFRDNLGPSFPIQFSDAIASENWCVAERLIHSLKSVSRTLGASALADAAVKLEASVASRNANAIAPLFVALSLQLDQVCRGLAAIDAEAAVHRASPTPIGAAEKEQLQRLQSLIVARDSEAAELVLEITEAMRQSPFGPQWSLLAREIERYEFAAAELLLNRFMEIIDCIP
jgi:CheY-like chemotaxis protein